MTMSPLRLVFLTGILIAALLITAGCIQSSPQTTTGTPGGTVTMTPSAQEQKLVRLETNMGNITIALDPAMPITAGNFETLVKKGYYDGVIFHRIIDGFMLQGGDPTGTGRGGPGYTIKDEFANANQNNRGTISMANAGPNTGGSQFFINLVNNNFLDTKHPVFGRVIEGMDVVDKIAKVKTDANDRPVQNVTIIHAVMV
ncbi:MAG TPA: peptidylprolyl isomerase [Methanoregula sp.]|nr:peptidylprolyl isomerase [Methanoregula sp.]